MLSSVGALHDLDVFAIEGRECFTRRVIAE
jgi:hypothetical protein